MALLVKAKAKRWSPTLRFTDQELILLDSVSAIVLEVADGLAGLIRTCSVQPIADIAEVARETQLIEAPEASTTSPLSALADLHHDGLVLSKGLADTAAGFGSSFGEPLTVATERLAGWIDAVETYARSIRSAAHLRADRRKTASKPPTKRSEEGDHV